MSDVALAEVACPLPQLPRRACWLARVASLRAPPPRLWSSPSTVAASFAAAVLEMSAAAALTIDGPVLRTLGAALRKIKAHQHAWPFLEPVPAGTAGYLELIAQPIDISAIESRLASGSYGSLEELAAAFELMFENCRKYNTVNIEGQVFLEAGDGLQKKVAKILERVRITHSAAPAPIVERPRRKTPAAAALELLPRARSPNNTTVDDPVTRKRPRDSSSEEAPAATAPGAAAAAAAAAPAGALGHIPGTDWQRWLDEDRKPYYFHTKQFITSAETPAEVAAAEDPTAAADTAAAAAADLNAFPETTKRTKRTKRRALTSSDESEPEEEVINPNYSFINRVYVLERLLVSQEEPSEEEYFEISGGAEAAGEDVIDLTDESPRPVAAAASAARQGQSRGGRIKQQSAKAAPAAAAEPKKKYMKPISRKKPFAQPQGSGHHSIGGGAATPAGRKYSTKEEFIHGILAWDFLKSLREEAAGQQAAKGAAGGKHTPQPPTSLDAVCFVYTCRRLIDQEMAYIL